MSAKLFVQIVREAQSNGTPYLRAILEPKYRGVRNARILIDGSPNGNRHDLWIVSPHKTIGRAYLKSKKKAQDLEGWPGRITALSNP